MVSLDLASSRKLAQVRDLIILITSPVSSPGRERETKEETKARKHDKTETIMWVHYKVRSSIQISEKKKKYHQIEIDSKIRHQDTKVKKIGNN